MQANYPHLNKLHEANYTIDIDACPNYTMHRTRKRLRDGRKNAQKRVNELEVKAEQE